MYSQIDILTIMNRSRRIYNEMHLLQETPMPTQESQPQPVPASTLTPIPIRDLHTDSRKRKRCDYETITCTKNQYMIYPSPVINVA